MHFKVANTFKLNPSAGLYQEGVSLSRANLLDIGPMLSILLSEIADARIPFVKYNDFTLVNVFVVDKSASIGYSADLPKAALCLNASVAVTFCLTSKPNRSLADAVVVRKTNGCKFLQQGYQQYITVSLPKLELDKLGLRVPHIEDLGNLYNQIGMISKNYVLNVRSSIVPPNDFPDDMASLYNRYHSRHNTVSSLAKNVPLTLWPYSKLFWTKLSNTFIEDVVPPKQFPLYWCCCLHNHIYNMDLSAGAKQFLDTTVVPFVSMGISQFQMCIGSSLQPYELKPELIAFFSLVLAAYVDDSFEGANLPDLQLDVSKYLGYVLNACATTPEYKQDLIQALSGVSGTALARNILDGAFSSDAAASVFDLIQSAVEYAV